jgi:hypothetical protein
MCCFFDETSGYVFLILYCKKGIFSFSPFLDIIVLVFDFFFCAGACVVLVLNSARVRT